MRLQLFGKGNPQKKLISFRFLNLVNGLVKAEADDKETSESVLIENKVLDTYLSDDDRLAGIVANSILEENGIVKCISEILEIFRTNPGLANDSLLEFLRYVKDLIQRHDVRLKTTDDGIAEFAEYANEFRKYIAGILEEDPTYSFYETDGISTKHADTFDLIILKDISEASTSQHKLDTENLMYLSFVSALTFWNFGGDMEAPSLKNWNITYAMLKAAINLCQIPDYPPYIYEFSQCVKKIDMEGKNSGSFDSTIKLTKSVHLNLKSLLTTEDAIIIRTKDNAPDRSFTNASRVIHGPGKPATKKPFIILYADENEQELYRILKEKLSAYPEEFPDTEDAYVVQILFDGAYYDKRIRWTTI
jgi:hypothetical protein